MLVITDSTALISLERIDQLELLPAVYPDLMAPPAVVEEFGRQPRWLVVRSPQDREAIREHLFRLALKAFDGHENAARTWFVTPKAVLDGETPLERLGTQPGLREVEDMLTVIDETTAG